MKRSTIIFLTLFQVLTACAQTDTASGIPDTINQRIFLIGDAGDMNTTTHPVIDWLKKHVDWGDDRNTVLFLGDNVYPEGLPPEGDPSYAHSKAILDDQISLVKGKKGRAFFVPGNHDWRNGKQGGWEQVMNQVDYINSLNQKNVQAWPMNGCPGPIQVELSDKVVVVIIDSQWFLYLHDKPGPGSNCDAKTIDEFTIELQEIAKSHPNQMMIVAMHHPIYSYSVHGGDYTLKEHIFPFTAMNPNLYIPLPVLGSVYPLARGVFGSVQDVQHPLYKVMANIVEGVLKQHPNPVFVSGHDHCLQMIVRDSIPYIVSGAGSKQNRVKPGKYELFADVNNGFSVIEVWKSGKTDVKFYNLSSIDYSAPTFTTQLKPIAPPPPAAVDTTRAIFDSVVIASANPKLRSTGFKNFMVGKNYRREWTQPLAVKVLDMGTDMGGLIPLRQGGGKQTKSLRVRDSLGREWALRTINKDPQAALPADLRQSFLTDVIADGISASYPYGALSMGVLSRAAGVPYLRNRLVYLPDDPRLLRFRSTFKNTMALMEEREPDSVKKSDNTDELVLKLAKDNDNHVDERLVLRARLLDNFVMDFDRHDGQWQWATRDTGKGKIYYPIPTDRDEVFYINEGFMPRIARSSWLVPELQGFRPHAHNIKTFNRTARNFDRTFLTGLSEDVWKQEVDHFLRSMTDSVIETALHRQPAELQKYRMNEIISKLKARRKYFAGEMMEYYRFLSRNVTIVGTNQREQFTITKNSDGTVQVVVNKISKKDEISSKIYDRTFDPNITKELAIYGLNDDDRFIVNGGDSKIKIRLIGGSGNDQFINNGTGKKVMVYDVTFEKNEFSGSTAFRKRVFADPQTNRYSRLNFKYNLFHPGLGLEYNKDDGVILGLKFEYIKQGFRKEPYGIRQFLEAKRSFRTNSYHFIYESDYIKAIRNTDIALRADIRAPINVTNFFGLGNKTRIEDRPDDMNYYRVRYNIINATAYLRYNLQSWMQLFIGPTFQYFKVDSAQNHGRFVTNDVVNGLDQAGVYDPHHYLGADARINIDSRNNPVLPTRGLWLNAGARQLFGLEKTSSNITQLNIDMRIFMNLFEYPRFVLGTRFGWARDYGNFQFPQAQYLGGTDNLRGFREQRFAGRSMLFNNTELRVRLVDFNTYLFGGTLGVLAFNDIGRVYMPDERTNTWHDGWGLGVWMSPIRRFVFVLSAAHSKEESVLPRFTFGFQF